MVESANPIERIIQRVSDYCSHQNGKTVIVAHGGVLKDAVAIVSNLKLHDTVEFIDVAGTDMSGKFTFVVETAYKAVLIAADNTAMMQKIGKLCGGYQDAGIPVVVIAGWTPPVDARFFAHAKISSTGNLTTAGMFDLVARFSQGGNRGDILEFGTFQGFTLQCAYHAFNDLKNAENRRFIAFDSFAGVIGVQDGEYYQDGDYSTSEESFRFSNHLAGVPEERVAVVSGPFETTLGTDVEITREKLGPVEAAVVHIDCDVEIPAKLALDFVAPYLKQGSMLLFDDYDGHHADNTKGERGALRAWLKENPEFEVELYRCYHAGARAFIVHKHVSA